MPISQNAAPLAALFPRAKLGRKPPVNKRSKGNAMAWTTPTLVEICIGLEINGYLPAEF
jgi:coenzyme PQQ precursor peptide PqqA